MVEKRPIGDSGIEVAPLALGGNVFGWTADEATSFAILDAFVDAGGTIEAVNEGGERHTFTKVEEFGNGCIPLLNADDSPPVVDCNALGDSEVLPGASRTFPVPATAGTVLYQCAIHPWMRSVVDVRAEGNRGGRG